MRTTVGRMMLEESLPEDLRDPNRTWDKKSVKRLFNDLATRYPEQYKDIAAKLMSVGAEISHNEGSSIRLSDLKAAAVKRRMIPALRAYVRSVAEDDSLSQKQKDERIVEAANRMLPKLQEAVYRESFDKGNRLADYVAAGARGSGSAVNQMLGAGLLVTDHHGNPVPVPITHGFAEGVDPVELWAQTYGVRRGYIDVKSATPKAGYFGKQLANAAHKLIVSDDAPLPGTGLPVDTDDPDNEGAVLARDTGKYKAGQILTPKVLKELRRQHPRILVHSPIASISTGQGIPRVAAGVRETGSLPTAGTNIGINAAQSVSEPLAQSAISCLAEGTLVRMADLTTKPIEAIRVGDRVLGSDTKGRLTPVAVTRVYDQGIQPCSEYVFRRGCSRKATPSAFETLVSTSEHKVLGRRKYSGKSGTVDDAGIFKVGSLNKLSGLTLSSGFDDTGYVDEDRAVLLGALLGDGCYVPSVQGIYLSCADESQMEWLSARVRKYGLKFHRQPGHDGIYYRLSQQKQRFTNRDLATGRLVAGKANHPIKKWLQELGIDGKYAHEKTIPAEAYTWSNKSVAELIAGLWVTDGSVYTTGSGVTTITFASTSLELVRAIKLLMSIRFGIHFGDIAENNHGNRRRTLYSIAASKPDEIRKFHQHIPLFGRKKAILQAVVDSGLPRRWEQKSGFMRVAGKEKVGLRHVYDIEVAHPDHLFLLANGMIVSNSKHQAGAVGHSGGGSSAATQQGFSLANTLANIPKEYPGRAPVVDVDGSVSRVAEAPQGGTYVYVGEHRFYVPPGLQVTVKPGQHVEAGDVVSEGIPNPADVVRYKGIGEGRRYFAQTFHRTLQDAGVGVSRRNSEIIARALINHIRLREGDQQGALPDDIVEYDEWAARYVPRDGAQAFNLKQAKGKYLEQPTLHYSIGTRLTPRVLKELREFGVDQVMAHDAEPEFEPEMQRAVDAMSVDKDWMVRLGGFGLQKSLLDATHRGAASERHGQSYLPAFAQGTEFAQVPGKPY